MILKQGRSRYSKYYYTPSVTECYVYLAIKRRLRGISFYLCEICAQCFFRDEVGEMFGHAYDGYLRYAYPYDELRPLSCDGVDTWGSYSLTLIDALDTLAVVGNHSEFRRSATPFCCLRFLHASFACNFFLFLMPGSVKQKLTLEEK